MTGGSKHTTRTILMTSVGSLVRHNILESLAPHRHKWRVVGVNSQPLAANNFRCDIAYLATESAQEKAFLSRPREIFRIEHPMVVLAGRDLDLPSLASLKAELEYAPDYFLDGHRPKLRRESIPDSGVLQHILRRLPASYLLDIDAVARLATFGVWRRAS